jgi:hypothetical protein
MDRSYFVSLDVILNGLTRRDRTKDSCHMLYVNVIASQLGQKLYYGFYLLYKIFSIQDEQNRTKAIGLLNELVVELNSFVGLYKNKEIVNNKKIPRNEQHRKVFVCDVGQDLKERFNNRVLDLKRLFGLRDKLNRELTHYTNGCQRQGIYERASAIRCGIYELTTYGWNNKLSPLEPITHQVYYDILSKRELIDFEVECVNRVFRHINENTRTSRDMFNDINSTINTLLDILTISKYTNDNVFGKTMIDLANWFHNEI